MKPSGIDRRHDDGRHIERRRKQEIALIPPLHALAGMQPLGRKPEFVAQDTRGQGDEDEVDEEINPTLPVAEIPR